jgi:HK97 gp10 family phage protein
MIELLGVKELEQAFKDLEKKLAKQIIQKAIKKALPPTRDLAQQLAPRRSGALAGSIKIRAMKRSIKGFGQNVVIGKNISGARTAVFYGKFQEKGWKHYKNNKFIPGKHFMGQAFSKTKEMAKRSAINEIRRGIREAVKK